MLFSGLLGVRWRGERRNFPLRQLRLLIIEIFFAIQNFRPTVTTQVMDAITTAALMQTSLIAAVANNTDANQYHGPIYVLNAHEICMNVELIVVH